MIALFSRERAEGTDFQFVRGVERRTNKRCFASTGEKSDCASAVIFRVADEKQAVRTQCEMKNIEDLRLRLSCQVNEKVATGNKIATRERRILQHIVRSEKNFFADFLAHAVTAVIAHKNARNRSGETSASIIDG